jgi:hypothetical protein
MWKTITDENLASILVLREVFMTFVRELEILIVYDI